MNDFKTVFLDRFKVVDTFYKTIGLVEWTIVLGNHVIIRIELLQKFNYFFRSSKMIYNSL